MSSLLNVHLPFQVTDQNGKVAAGARARVFDAGTTTDADTYQEIGLVNQHPQPIIANASGFLPQIYAPPGQLYKVVLEESSGAEIVTLDNLTPYIASDGGVLPVSGGGTNAATPDGARTELEAAAAADVSALTTTVSDATTSQSQADWDAGVSQVRTTASPEQIAGAIRAIARPASPAVVLSDQRPSGVAGGDTNPGAWILRVLNTEDDPDSLVTMANSIFQFSESGYVFWSAPAAGCGEHKSRLFNVTNNFAVSIGTAEVASQATPSQTRSFGGGRVEANKDYRIEHRTTGSQAGDGFGVPTGIGENEVYTIVEFYPDL